MLSRVVFGGDIRVRWRRKKDSQNDQRPGFSHGGHSSGRPRGTFARGGWGRFETADTPTRHHLVRTRNAHVSSRRGHRLLRYRGLSRGACRVLYGHPFAALSDAAPRGAEPALGVGQWHICSQYGTLSTKPTEPLFTPHVRSCVRPCDVNLTHRSRSGQRCVSTGRGPSR